MAKRRTFTVELSGVLPKGLTLAQARHAVWNQGLDLDIDIDAYFDDGRRRRYMKLRVGKARLNRKD